MEPITRVEMFMAAAADEYDGELPEPKTRLEYYLKKIAEGAAVKPEDIDAAIEAYLNSHDADIVTEAELIEALGGYYNKGDIDTALGGKADVADIPDVSDFVTTAALAEKQDALTAGDNISIETINGELTISATDTTYSDATQQTHGLMSTADKTKLDGITAAKMQAWDAAAQDTNTDTKVTSAANHYAPAEDASAVLSADASGSTAATWNSTSLVTGVDIKRDAKGHVVGVAVDSVKMPANPNTNTTYSAGTGLSLSGTTFSNSAPNVKSDWNAAAGTDAEILNKPTIPNYSNATPSTNGVGGSAGLMSAADKTKLDGQGVVLWENLSGLARTDADGSNTISIPYDISDYAFVEVYASTGGVTHISTKAYISNGTTGIFVIPFVLLAKPSNATNIIPIYCSVAADNGGGSSTFTINQCSYLDIRSSGSNLALYVETSWSPRFHKIVGYK